MAQLPDTNETHGTQDAATGVPEGSDLARSCAELQGELDALLDEHEQEEAVASLDTAVASLKDVQEHNVSSVQLVALAGR